MQRRKKQLLGLAGLVLVAVITAIAFALPNPEASAADADKEPSEFGVNLRVEVKDQSTGEDEDAGKAAMIAPADLSDVVTSNLPIKFSYRNTSRVRLYLSKYDANGKLVSKTEIEPGCDLTYSSQDQVCEFNYNLGEYSSDVAVVENAATTYVLEVSPRAGDVTDAVKFFYRAAKMTHEGKVEDKTGNPFVTIYLNEVVDHGLVQVYDEAGNPVFMKDGKETPLVLTAEQIKQANGKLELLLPLSQYGAKAGKYRAVLVAYNAENKVVAIASVNNIAYNVKAPEVPGTGNNLLRDLNISSADYLIAGLLAFGLVAGFALFLVIRRNRR